MRTGMLVIAALVLVPLASPADAQFSGLFAAPKKKKPASDSDGCDTSKTSVGKSILGSVLGSVTSSATRNMGGVGYFVPSAAVAGLLTDAIACKLDESEQKQAADATVEATRGEEVGSSASWTSATRDNVSGTSTVRAKTASADGGNCMTVTDVIIVEGEETTVDKRMCRAPGASGYTLAA